MKIQRRHEFQKRRRRSIPLSIIHVLECFLRVIKGHRSRILMFTVFAWYKWRNCTQSRLVLGKLYTIAVFLSIHETLNKKMFLSFQRHSKTHENTTTNFRALLAFPNPPSSFTKTRRRSCGESGSNNCRVKVSVRVKGEGQGLGLGLETVNECE